MSTRGIALVIATVIAGHAISIGLLVSLQGRPASEGSAVQEAEKIITSLRESLAPMRRDIERLSTRVASRPAANADDLESTLGKRVPELLADVVARLERLEKSVAARNEVADDAEALKLREERLKQFRADDGFVLAEELLAERKFAVGANGLLTFLEAHPEHPDKQDLMRRARDGFRQSGYLDKALWLQGEIMKEFPEHRAADLHIRARLELRMRRYDDALRHLDESVRLTTTANDRIARLFTRAELLHLRDGDEAGLEAYREVERLSKAAGAGQAAEAARRAERIAERLDES